MSEEKKNAAELTDEQLDSVAGGEGGSDGRYYIVIAPRGTELRMFASMKSPLRSTIGYNETLKKLRIEGAYLYTSFHGREGYVLLDDLEEVR